MWLRVGLVDDGTGGLGEALYMSSGVLVSCTRLHGAAVEDKGQEQLVGRR